MTLDTGIEPKRPTPLLQRDLDVDWRAALLGLSKSLILRGFGDRAGAAGNAVDALGSLGLRGSLEEDAWRLIVKALSCALLDLLPPQAAEALPSDEHRDQLAEDLLKDPSIGGLRLPPKFFENPRQWPGLARVQEAFAQWLSVTLEVGADAFSTAAHLPDKFCIGVDVEWRRNSAKYTSLSAAFIGPATGAAQLVNAWRDYRTAFSEKLKEMLKLRDAAKGNPFMPVYAECSKRLGDADGSTSVLVDVWDELVQWCESRPDHQDWLRIVAGRFGSGRTTLASYIVAKLSDYTICRSLYVPLDGKEADWTLEQSVQSALQHSPFFDDRINLLKPGENDPLVFVLDGWPAGSGAGKLKALLEYLDKCNLGGDARRRIILTVDNPLPEDIYADLTRPEAVFYLVPFLPIDYEQSAYAGRSDLLDEDRRLAWWPACVGGDLPAVLLKPPLREITASPLMLRFVGELYCENPTRFSDAPRDLVDLLAEFKLRTFPDIEEESRERVLMDLALALWQCKTTPTADAVVTYLQGVGVFGSARIEAGEFARWTNDNPFLMRRSPAGGAPEFVSEGLRDYLSARAITAAIEKLIEDKLETSRVLEQWLLRFGQAPVTPGIVEELRALIGQRYKQDSASWHPLLIQWFAEALVDPPAACCEDPYRTLMNERERVANASESLLAALNACAYAVDRLSNTTWPSRTAFRDWLACLQGQRRDMDAAYRMILSHLDFSPADDDENAKGADLSCLDLSDCDLSHCNLDRTDVHLSDLTNTDLSYTSLVDANLSGTRMKNTLLYRAEISGGDFDGIEMYGVSETGRQEEDGINCDESFRQKLKDQASKPRERELAHQNSNKGQTNES